MSTPHTTRPVAALKSARVTPAGTTIITFDGFPTIRSKKVYPFLIVSLRDSSLPNVTFASIAKGTANPKTARSFVANHSGRPHETLVLLSRTEEGYQVAK